MTTTLTASPADVATAGRALQQGETVVIPTETVYGLAADATNPAAVAAVYAAKGRPADDPLIVHVSPALLGASAVDGLVARGVVGPMTAEQDAATRQLVGACWPGPLTLVLPRGDRIPEVVSSRLPTVAVRMPVHPVAQAVIDAAGRPLVAPSANQFARISPTTAAAARAELDGRVPYVLDGGPCDVGVESTVVRVDLDGEIGVLRPGAITAADLEAATGSAPYRVPQSEGIAGAPGRMLRHYAPATALVVSDGAPDAWSEARWQDVARRASKGGLAYVTWSRELTGVHASLARLGDVHVRALAPGGAPTEAAHNLYATLRELDGLGVALIVVEKPPKGGGLAEAVADRLARAAHGTDKLAP